MNTGTENNTARIGFIGAGRAGCSLGKIIAEGAAAIGMPSATVADAVAGATGADVAAGADIALSGYYSRKPASARDAAAFTGACAYGSLGALLAESDIVVASVPDDAIAEIWEQVSALLKPAARRPRAICHLSGGMTSEVFAGADSLGVEAASLHPLYAIANRHSSWQGLSRASFTFEGSDAACAAFAPLTELLCAQGAAVARIGTDKKNLYHAACVFFSNFACGLAGIGEDIFRECGLDGEFAASAWHTLFADNAKNVVQMGAAAALTGPAERGDVGTVTRHMESLSALSPQGQAGASANNYLKIYREMTRALTKIAAAKNPGRDYADMLDALATAERET